MVGDELLAKPREHVGANGNRLLVLMDFDLVVHEWSVEVAPPRATLTQQSLERRSGRTSFSASVGVLTVVEHVSFLVMVTATSP